MASRTEDAPATTATTSSAAAQPQTHKNGARRQQQRDRHQRSNNSSSNTGSHGNSQRRGNNSTNETPEVRLSKLLSFALRHGAEKLRLDMRESGYVALAQLLAHPKFRGYSEAQIEAVVHACPKKRFALATDAHDSSIRYIRANQGHSLARVQDAELLEPIERADAVAACIHGTYTKHWPSILATGLSRMTRNHMHFTTRIVPAGDVVSGMRTSCDLLLFIDIERAMADGIPFFRSSNNVILSAGNDGVLPTKYFLRAVQTDGTVLYDRDANDANE